MRIAATSQNYRTVTGHAGMARRFIVFEADEQTPPREIERLDLDTNMAIHGLAVEAFLNGRMKSPSGSCNQDHGQPDGVKHAHDEGQDQSCNCHG